MNAQQLKNSILQDLFSPKDNWKEKELKDIVSKKCPISYGIVQQGDHVEDGIPVVRPVDLHCKFVSRKNLKCTTPDISASYQRTILRGDEILLCVRGTTGIVALATNEIEGCNVNRGIVPLFFDGDIDRMFMYYQLQTPKIQETISSNTMGSALRQINIKDLRSILLTYPPIDEQRKVVEILETIMPKVEEYGKAQEALDKLNEELPERLKKSILQEAIEGRLVPQDPNDEPASVLLDKIRKEKARLVKEGKLKKKDLEETPIEENEIPFKIPKSWEWCRVGTVAEYVNGLAFKPEDWETSGLPIIRIQNLTDYNKPLNYTTKKFDDKFKVENGDLLFSWSATLDSFIWKGQTAWLNQHVFKVNPRVGIFKRYLYYALKAIVSNLSDITHGLTMKHLTRGVFENYSFPLPPLAEQKRIVAKIEQLMKEIDKLKV
ncbi:MAG: restriction endonuclease subunit S [Prevotella sp.]|nr:restriction endonuclease subunit S [Prevotella sp.]